MTDYVKSVNFATKDALITGDPLKVVKGTEINTELDALATSSATKFDKAGGTITGTTSVTAPLTLTSGFNNGRASIVQNATTMDLFALSNTIDGTGSAVVITAIVNAPQAGARRVFYPITGTTITQNAMFAVDGGASYISTAGDGFEFEAITTATYKVHIIRASIIPVFSAYQTVAQSLATATSTKLQFQTKEFDIGTYFDAVTNFRYTPLVAGYYQVNGAFTVATAIATISLIIFKNGASFKTGSSSITSGGGNVNALVFLNGTTDFIELFATQSAAAQNTVAAATNTYFQAVYVRGA